MVRRFSGRCLSVLLALSLGLVGCGGSSSSGGGPSGSGVDGGSGLGGPNSYGPGTGTPGLFAPPSGSPSPTASPTTPPPIYDPDTDAALLSISVSPNPLTVYIANTEQLTVTGHLDDGSTVTLVNSSEVSVSFSTVSNTAAIVSPTGLVTGIWFGTETVTATVVVDGTTFSVPVPVNVTIHLYDQLFDSLFNADLDSSWTTQYVNTVMDGGVTYPIISLVNSFDPLLPPPPLPEIRTLSLEVPSGSIGGISQVVNLSTIDSDEVLILDFLAVAKMNPVVITVEINGPSSNLSQDFYPPALYSSPSVPTGFSNLLYYDLDVSAFAGETVEVRFLASSLSPPGAPGDTSVAIQRPTLAIWPAGPYVPVGP